ncbi:hypothetical protein Avbf_16242 [Armadillidium vulgare]|nr:hypothetical protein Avbf_16242 [Armadillidium vulgare]
MKRCANGAQASARRGARGDARGDARLGARGDSRLGEDAALLYLLPLLLKPKKIALPLKKDTFWKPSKRDMQEAFVIHVQNPVDVPVTISRKQEKLSQMSFEHATICNFARGKDLLNIAQIVTSH